MTTASPVMTAPAAVPRIAARAPLVDAADLSFAWLLTWVTAALLLVSSAIGLVNGWSGWYGYDTRTVPAFLAQDAVSLMGLPLLLISAVLARRGSTRARLCWMGGLFYIAYSYYFYVAGAPLTPLYPAYIVLVSLGMYGALSILFGMSPERFAQQVGPAAPVRFISAFLAGTAVFFAVLWTILVARHVVAGEELSVVTRGVIAVDGVVVLPLLFFGGLWLHRRTPLGFVLAGVLLVKTAATFFTLLVASMVAWSWEVDVDRVQTTAFTVGLGLSLGLLVSYLRAIRDEG